MILERVHFSVICSVDVKVIDLAREPLTALDVNFASCTRILCLHSKSANLKYLNNGLLDSVNKLFVITRTAISQTDEGVDSTLYSMMTMASSLQCTQQQHSQC